MSMEYFGAAGVPEEFWMFRKDVRRWEREIYRSVVPLQPADGLTKYPGEDNFRRSKKLARWEREIYRWGRAFRGTVSC